jgi:hypothetical protein
LFINSSAGTFDLQSYYWAITQRKRYRVRLSMFMSSNFSGFIMPAVHIPNTAWAVPGAIVNDPAGQFPAGHTGESWGRGSWFSREAIYTASPATANQAQLRIAGRVSAGYCEIYVEMFLIEDVITASTVSTFIADAAIGNAQIANLDAGKINAGFINAGRINVNTINAGMIISKSATSFEQHVIAATNDVFVTQPFFMDHAGFVSVVATGLYTQSGDGGVWGVYLNIDGDQSYQATGSAGRGPLPQPPALMKTRYLEVGWHSANHMLYTSAAAPPHHVSFILILKSYR